MVRAAVNVQPRPVPLIWCPARLRLVPMAVAETRGRVVLDPIYGYIKIPPRLDEVVAHPLVQRLRRVSQTSLLSSVYPSATGSRFDHALGAMHLAGVAWDAVWRNSQPACRRFITAAAKSLSHKAGGDEEYSQLIRDAVSCVALLHDVGHPPFSHALEAIYDSASAKPNDVTHGGQYHEVAGEHLSGQILDTIGDPPLQELTMLIYVARRDQTSAQPSGWAAALHEIVAGELDVDRLDYLLRDANRAGTEYGAIDHVRLLDALELHEIEGEYHIGPGVRARSAAEMMLLQRTQAFRWVYFHPRVVAADLFLLRAVEQLRRLGDWNETVQLADHIVRLGDLFRHVSPSWDYLVPSREAVERAIGIKSVQAMPMTAAATTSGGAPVPLFDPDLAPAPAFQILQDGDTLYEDLWSDVQAGFDDDTVRVSLRRAYLLARSVLSAVKLVDDADVRAFVRYYDAAVLRRKNFVPVWKNYEEFEELARSLVNTPDRQGPLRSAIANAFEGVRPTDAFKGMSDGIALLRGEIEDRFADPVALLNYLGYWLVRRQRRALGQHLTEVRPSGSSGLRGSWDAAYRDFAPVRRRSQLSVLYRDDAQTVELWRTSPLVRSLTQVEAHRVKLFVYYFVESSSRVEPRSQTDVRADLRRAFGEAFPIFVERTYGEVLKERLFRLATGGE